MHGWWQPRANPESPTCNARHLEISNWQKWLAQQWSRWRISLRGPRSNTWGNCLAIWATSRTSKYTPKSKWSLNNNKKVSVPWFENLCDLRTLELTLKFFFFFRSTIILMTCCLICVRVKKRLFFFQWTSTWHSLESMLCELFRQRECPDCSPSDKHHLHRPSSHCGKI